METKCLHCGQPVKKPSKRRTYLNCIHCGARHWVKDTLTLRLCKDQPESLTADR